MSGEPTEFGDGRPDLDDVKRARRENPSGWLELSMDPARALIIDALLDAPPGYEFSPPELAPRAGVSAQSVRNHIDVLRRRGIVETIGHSQYRVNDRGRIMVELKSLNSAVTAVRSGMARSSADYVDPDELMDNSGSDRDGNGLIDATPDLPPVNAD